MRVPTGDLSWRAPAAVPEPAPPASAPQASPAAAAPAARLQVPTVDAPGVAGGVSWEEAERAAKWVEGLDANQAWAEVLRRRLGGAEEEAALLERYLEECRGSSSSQAPRVELVPHLDRLGRPLPAPSPAAQATAGGGRKRRRGSEKGDAQAEMTVAEMVLQEKAEDARAFQAAFVENVVRGTERGETHDAELGEARFFDRTRQKRQQSAPQRAVLEHRRYQQTVESCWFCFENPRIERHLIVSLGEHTYLALPKRGRLVDGHCLLVPMRHVTSMAAADEEVYEEMQRFKSGLVRMLAERGDVPVFLETASAPRKLRHTFVECVPLPGDLAAAAPGYFKKALLESEREWSDNVKLIDVPARGGLRRAVPKELPYFCVEFGNGRQAFAHVIEDARDFPLTFGKEVLAGMLELDPDQWRHPRDPPKETQLAWVKEVPLVSLSLRSFRLLPSLSLSQYVPLQRFFSLHRRLCRSS